MADGLFEQLRGESESGAQIPRVSSHDLVAMVSEVRRSEIAAPAAKAALGLTDQTVIDLTAIIAEITAGRLTNGECRDILDLTASRRAPYDVKTAWAARLGI